MQTGDRCQLIDTERAGSLSVVGVPQPKPRRRTIVTSAHALDWDAQLSLPGFGSPLLDRLTGPERMAYDDLRKGPFALGVDELVGYARDAHTRYRARGVPLAWVHHEQLARALGLVILRDHFVPVGIVTGSLVRLRPESTARGDRQIAFHECAEHLLRKVDATHPDVNALMVLLQVEREDVIAAVRKYGQARAHTALAKVHRRVPAWVLRTCVALTMLAKPL